MKTSHASKVETPAPVDRRKAAPAEQETTGGGGGVKSKAQAFDEVSPGGGAVPAGKYEAVLKEAVLQDPDDKGQSARFKVLIASENYMGEELTWWNKIFDVDENPTGGVKFLKQTLAKLGYPDVTFDDLESVFEELTNDHPGCAIQVKINEGYTNVYINGLIEDSPAIRALHETNPF